jgi:hypothetical protein
MVAGNQKMLKMDTFAKIEKPGCQLPKILVYHSFLKKKYI